MRRPVARLGRRRAQTAAGHHAARRSRRRRHDVHRREREGVRRRACSGRVAGQRDGHGRRPGRRRRGVAVHLEDEVRQEVQLERRVDVVEVGGVAVVHQVPQGVDVAGAREVQARPRRLPERHGDEVTVDLRQQRLPDERAGEELLLLREARLGLGDEGAQRLRQGEERVQIDGVERALVVAHIVRGVVEDVGEFRHVVLRAVAAHAVGAEHIRTEEV
mmetsp:Transcript_5707/g.17932  ORF Transcript_5707/g.17932 Transcript_5707/m.17932 type:complete len:218 (+) Transcript_5707:538-1191(+)